MPEMLAAGVIVGALVLYALTGGADFGGGILDLTARGPRGRALRDLIARAIGPIWEANHVWLILVVVVLFVCFPRAFAVVMTALHIPLAVMLVGVVMRGSAFVFRGYDDPSELVARRWSLVFAASSLLTPLALGTTLGAVASGALRLDPATGRVLTDFVSAWLAPFPLAVGGLVTALFALLAATYLAMETEDPALREDLRRRGLGAGVLTGTFAFLSLALAAEGAPRVWAGLAGGPWSLPFQVVTGGVAVGALLALARRRWALARGLAAGQVVLVSLGWAASQWPMLVPPDLDIASAAAPPSVIVPVLWALGLGAIGLFPALFWLYRVFGKRVV